MPTLLEQSDPALHGLMRKELLRQQSGLELIASENYVSTAVLQATGSVLTNKYSEGYPGRRYYGGNAIIDEIETIAIDRAKKLFGAEHANVQPHSGSQANMQAYFALLKLGDPLLAMDIAHGGHLTHGAKVSFAGQFYQVHTYGVSQKQETLDMDEVRAKAKSVKPKLLIAGASAYPRAIDFAAFRAIADEVGALFLTDIAHVAGLIVANLHPSPFPLADVVTTTTHKTLRGPRGALIFSKAAHAAAIDKAVMPGMQGGPLDHVIAAKAVALHEAAQPSFIEYQQRVVANARVLSSVLVQEGIRLVSGGTDTHLLLVDVTPLGIAGKEAETALELAGIYVNKNLIPFDTRKPLDPSGIRIGTPALTTRGFSEDEFRRVGKMIADILHAPKDAIVREKAKKIVQELTALHPIYEDLDV